MKTSTRTLVKFLSNDDVTFFIPPYQRNYEWTEEQCSIFLEDIKGTAQQNRDGGKAEHFFGTITYFQEASAFGQPDRLILVDGQQRITTTMLFLAALRDVTTKKETKDFIDKKYLTNPDATGDALFTVKLKQVESDWELYRRIVLNKPLHEKDKERPIGQNYLFFKRELERLCEGDAEATTGLNLVQNGLAQFRIVAIELEPMQNSWENPQEIFESMNSLGKPLSLADLVRNYLLMGLGAETQTVYYNQYWLRLERALKGHVSDFIRDYMQMCGSCSLHKATERNSKQLYREFKSMFDPEISSNRERLLGSLAEHAETYATILFGGTGSGALDNVLQDLRTLKETTAYSFLLALLQARKRGEFTDEDTTQIVKAFWIYIARRRICNLTAGQNKGFPLLVNELAHLKEATDKQLETFKILDSQGNVLRLPADEEVANQLRVMNFYSFQYCRFYLALIEEALTKSRPDLNDSRLQVEHIMPQTLTAAWKQMIGPDEVEQHPQNVHLIGNLTLIRHNQELGQKSFDEKCVVYKNNSGLQLAHSKIVDCEKWTEKEIHERAEWLIDCMLRHTLPAPRLQETFIETVTTKQILGLLVGKNVAFYDDTTIEARVLAGAKVEFEGQVWSLAGLTREIMERKGRLNASGAYQGTRYWLYKGKPLVDLSLDADLKKPALHQTDMEFATE